MLYPTAPATEFQFSIAEEEVMFVVVNPAGTTHGEICNAARLKLKLISGLVLLN